MKVVPGGKSANHQAVQLSKDGFYARKYNLGKNVTGRDGVFAIAEVTDNPKYPPPARYILDVFIGISDFSEVRIEWYAHGFGEADMAVEEMNCILDADIQSSVSNYLSWDITMAQLDNAIQHHYEGT